MVDLLQTTGTKGGIEVYIRELWTAIGDLGTSHEFVGYASSELVATDHSWFPGDVLDSGIQGENRFAWAAGEMFGVSKTAKRLGADLIHCPAMLGPIRSDIPVVLTIHDLLYFSHPHLMRDRRLTSAVKWMERRAASNAREIVTISRASAAAIREYLGRDSTVIPLAPSRVLSATLSNTGAVRRNDLFIAIGQRSPYKDFETVVRSWAQIPKDERPTLIITGSHGEDPLRSTVDELDLDESVHLREWISTDELGELMATATALIDPTLAAGFGLPIIEAMASGLPVIATDIPVFREVGGDAILHFAAGSTSELAAAVHRVRSDAVLRQTLADSGQRLAAGTSWGDVATQTMEVFEAALR